MPYIAEYQLIFRCRLDSFFIHPLNIFPLEEIMESNYTIFAKGSNSINIRRLISHLKQENV